jgi:hypothetical protein
MRLIKINYIKQHIIKIRNSIWLLFVKNIYNFPLKLSDFFTALARFSIALELIGDNKKLDTHPLKIHILCRSEERRAFRHYLPIRT